MRQTKLLLLLLLALVMSATGAFAQTVGTQFTINGVIYQITAKNLTTHANEVAVRTITGSGAVTVPDKVQNQQDKEWYNVTSTTLNSTIGPGVTSVTFSEGLKTIRNNSFNESPATLTQVNIPASCTEIQTRSFMNCSGLTTFTVAPGNSNYKADSDGAIVSADGTTLICVPSGKSGDYTVPGTVTTINPYAFGQCRNLGTINIPASVSTMTFTKDEGASIYGSATDIKVASDNTSFKDIDGVLFNKDATTLYTYPYNHATTGIYTVPATVKTIAPYAATYANKIYGINLNQVETVGDFAFEFTSLVNVNIGEKVSKIGEAAFVGCWQLASLTVDDANQYYKDADNVLFTKDGTHLMICSAKKTGDYVIPDGVTDIDFRAFYQNTGLNKVSVPTSVVNIGGGAFGRTNIKTIDFATNGSLKSIGADAFSYSNKLTAVTIPKSVETIGYNAFRWMSGLTSVEIEDGSKLKVIDERTFSDNPNLETVSFAGSSALTEIKYMAFSNDPKLKSFTIPASVTTIGNGAFLNTTNLTTVTFAAPASITRIGSNSFASSGITAIEIPTSVKEIAQQAFDNCKNLTTIDIPASVTNIGMGAFNMCEDLTDIHVDAANTRYSSLDGILCSKDKNTLEVFPAGKANSKNTLLPYFKKVAAYAFYGSEKVTNITFPKTVTTIEDRALALCKNLKTLSFMGTDNVPVLSENITYNSANPKNITIYVRKAWYENSANNASVTLYNTKFKEVHPSFVTTKGYDRGTEFFPTSDTNAGVIGFYTERTSVILSDKTKEEAVTTPDRFGKTFPEKDYNVNTILDYAYQNTTKVKTIVALPEMDYIGLDAFKGSSIQDLYFVGNVPGELGSLNYELMGNYPFKDGQNIYVKESKTNAYQNAWTQGHTLNITYKIPQQTNRYGGSVCFPFDVIYPTGQGNNDIKPYAPIEYDHAYDTSNPFVKAYSIDDYYVPAFVGALIRSKDAVSVNSYCQMDEDQAHSMTTISGLGYSESAGNHMVGIVEDTPITNESGYQYYAFSKSQGKFVQLKDGATFPYFKAYLRMASSAAAPAKGFSIMFDDDSTVTSINGIVETDKGSDNAPYYYNLNGVRVSKPSHGVYIHNGKKVIIK